MRGKNGFKWNGRAKKKTARNLVLHRPENMKSTCEKSEILGALSYTNL